LKFGNAVLVGRRADGGTPDLGVVERAADERADAIERRLGVRNQVFVAHFEIIGAEGLGDFPALAQQPLPIQSSGQHIAMLVPGQHRDVAQCAQGGGHVASVANDVKEEGVGNHPLDFGGIEQVLGSFFGPPVAPLPPRDTLHEHRKKSP